MIEDRDWQKIGYGTNRLKVPGGWFVMLYIGGPAKTAFFYPDPEHTWDGGALKEQAAAEAPLPPPTVVPKTDIVPVIQEEVTATSQ